VGQVDARGRAERRSRTLAAAKPRSQPFAAGLVLCLDPVRYQDAERQSHELAREVGQQRTVHVHRLHPLRLAAPAVLHHTARHRQMALHAPRGDDDERGALRRVRGQGSGVLRVCLARHRQREQHRHQPGHDPAPSPAVLDGEAEWRRRRSPPPSPADPSWVAAALALLVLALLVLAGPAPLLVAPTSSRCSAR